MKLNNKHLNKILLAVLLLVTAYLFISPYFEKGESGSAPEKPQKKKAVPVHVSPVVRGHLENTFTATALVTGQSTVKIVAQQPGIIRQMHVILGEAVRQGQQLALLDDRLLQAELQQSQAALNRSKLELERVRQLAARQLVDRKRLEAAQAQWEIDKAAVNKVRTTLSLLRFPSPIKGIVTEQLAETGDMVEAGAPLYTITNIANLHVQAKIPEQYAADLKVGNKALVYRLEVPEEKIPATILHVAPASDPTSHQVMLELNVGPVFPQLKPGYQVNVFLTMEKKENTLVLDRRAVVEDPVDGEATVFVLRNGLAEKRRIKLGLILENKVEVLEGLAEGDQVVTQGMESLKDQDSVVVAPVVGNQKNK